MSAGIEFDEKEAAETERSYLTADIAATRTAVMELLAPGPGERVLDVGSGPGLLLPDLAPALAELYRVLNPGGRAVVMATDADTILFGPAGDTTAARIREAWPRHCAHPFLPRELGRCSTRRDLRWSIARFTAS